MIHFRIPKTTAAYRKYNLFSFMRYIDVLCGYVVVYISLKKMQLILWKVYYELNCLVKINFSLIV